MNKHVKNAIYGLIGGVAGTFVIAKTTASLRKFQSDHDKTLEKQMTPEQPTERLAGQLAGDQNKRVGGQVIHWGYGILWGCIYGLLRETYPGFSRAAGFPFAVAFTALGEEALLPLANLTPPLHEYPRSTAVRDIAAHYAYASTVEGTCRLLNALEDAVAKRQQRTSAELRKVS